MRIVVQRVKSASCVVNHTVISNINKGLLLLVGIHKEDSLDDTKKLARKVASLRIFEDDDHKLNLSIKDVGGEILSISQFTLYGDARKGNRPSFVNAMSGKMALNLYNKFNKILEQEYNINTQIGAFGEHMDISLVNDGPVTIILES